MAGSPMNEKQQNSVLVSSSRVPSKEPVAAQHPCWGELTYSGRSERPCFLCVFVGWELKCVHIHIQPIRISC